MKILISQIADITWQKYYSRSISRTTCKCFCSMKRDGSSR